MDMNVKDDVYMHMQIQLEIMGSMENVNRQEYWIHNEMTTWDAMYYDALTNYKPIESETIETKYTYILIIDHSYCRCR
jgi:hypothetical protein